MTAALSTPVSAATTRTWVATGPGNASTSANWSPIGVPSVGDSLVFSSASVFDCTFDVNVATLTDVTINPGYTGILGLQPAFPMTFAGNFVQKGGRVEFRDFAGPFFLVNSVTVTGGTYHVGHTTMTVVSPATMTFTGGALDTHDLAIVHADVIDIRSGAALNMYDNNVVGGPTFSGLNTTGMVLLVSGTLNVSSGTFQHLSAAGVVINPTASIASFSSVTFAGPQDSGGSAINFVSGGSFVSTFTNVRFADSGLLLNVSAPSLTGRITFRGPTGPRAGPAYEYDPNNRVDWPGFAAASTHAHGAVEIPVAQTDDDEFPIDASFGGGEFLIPWQYHLAGSSSVYGAQAALLDASGALVAPPFTMNSSGWCGESAPTSAFDGANFLLVSACGGIDADKLQAQLIDPSGSLVGTTIEVNAGPTNGGAVAFDGTNYLVVWNTTTSPQNVYGQLVSPAGSLVGSPISISVGTHDRRNPAVAFGAGQYLVVWSDDQRLHDGLVDDIAGRFVHTDGSTPNPEFTINQGAASGDNPPFAATDGNAFFVAWQNQVGGSPNGNWNVSGAIVTSTGGIAAAVPITSDPAKSQLFAKPVWDGANYQLFYDDAPTLATATVHRRVYNAAGAQLGVDALVAGPASGKIPNVIGAAFGGGKTLAVVGRTDVGTLDQDADTYGLLLPASASLSFTGGFGLPDGADVAATGANQIGTRVLSDTTTAGGPYAYVLVLSTTSSVNGSLDPVTYALVRYNGAGAFLSSAAVTGDVVGDGLVQDPAGNVYVSARKDNPRADWVAKYSSNLVFLSSAALDGVRMDSIEDLAWSGSSLYAHIDGALARLDANLNILSSTTHNDGVSGGMAIGGGSVYLSADDQSSPMTTHLLKFQAGFANGAAATADMNVSALTPLESTLDLAFSGSSVYMTSLSTSPDKIYVRKFDANLNYTGVSSTFTSVNLQFFGVARVRTGPNGNLFVVTSSTRPGGDIDSGFLVLEYDPNLVLLSSAVFNGIGGAASRALDVAVQDAGHVYATGVSCAVQGGNLCQAATVRLGLSAPATVPPASGFDVSGNFTTGAVVASTNGFNDYGTRVLVDAVSPGGPFEFVLIHATDAAVNQEPDVAVIVKYDSAGNLVASTILTGNSDGAAMALDNGGRLYIAETSKDSNGAVTGRWITKYAPDLTFLARRNLSNAVDSPTDMLSDGTNVYALHPSGSGLPSGAKLVKYSPALVPLSTATFASGAAPIYTHSLARDAAGNFYFDLKYSPPLLDHNFHTLVKYGPSATGSTPLASFALDGSQLDDAYDGNLAVAGSALYLAAYDFRYPIDVSLRKFDLNLNYTGVSSTFTAGANPNGRSRDAALVRPGPDGSLYLMTTTPGTDGGDYVVLKYDQNLNLLATAGYGGAAMQTDQAYDLAVKDAAHVYVTGASQNANSDTDAATAVLDLTSSADAAPLNFNGTFASPGGATVFASGRTTAGGNIITDPVNGFTYVVLASTSGGFFDQPYQASIVKYDSGGVMVASAALAGVADEGDGFVADSAGGLYVSEKNGDSSAAWITKYDSSLVFIASAAMDSSVTNITRMASDGTYIYAALDSNGGSGMGAQLWQFDTALNVVNSVYYEDQSFPLSQALTLDGAGNAYWVIASTGDAPPFVQRLLKIDSGLYIVDDTALSSLVTSQPGLAFAGQNVYTASVEPAPGAKLTLRKFDASANYTGSQSTFPYSSPIGPFAHLKSGPDGTLYAVTFSTALGVMRFDQSLRLISTAAFGGPGTALAVQDSSNVFVTGGRPNGARFDASTRLLNMSKGAVPYVANLDVFVKTPAGDPVPGALVAAVHFSTATGQPDPAVTKTAVSDANGRARFTPSAGNWLADLSRYDIFASSQAFLPSMRDQFNMPSHPSIFTSTGVPLPPIAVILVSSPIARGEVDVDVIGATPSSLIFGSIQAASGGNTQPVAMGLLVADGSGAGRLKFYNVPFAAANTFKISALDAAGNRAASRMVDSDLSTGTPLLVYASAASLVFTNALPPIRNPVSGVLGLDGMLQASDDQTGAAGLKIQYDYLAASGSSATIRVTSDRNGRFQLGNLAAGTTYYAKIFSGCGTNGCFDGSFSSYTAFGDAPRANDLLYTGVPEVRVIPLNRRVGAGGRLGVFVTDPLGRPIPQAAINVFPDPFPWSSVSNPGPATVNAPATTGYLLVDGLSPGNYTLQVFTQLSGQPSVYNFGPDGQSNLSSNGGCGSDDIRLTVESDLSVSLYDGCGAQAAASLSSVTVVVGASSTGLGLVKGTLTFPAAEDLTGDPITISLQPDCAGSGCPSGFTVIGGSVAKTVPYSVRVASGVTYQLGFSAKYWGVADRNGGQRTVSLVSTGTAVVNFSVSPAGRVVGSVYLPDGTLFAPSADGATTANVGANGLNSSGQRALNSDGTFVIGGLLPSSYGLSVSGSGPGFTYADRSPLPKALVTAGKDTNQDITLLAGAGMIVSVDTHTLPAMGYGPACPAHSEFECPPQQWVVDYFPRGADLSRRVSTILLDDDEQAQFGFNAATDTMRCSPIPGVPGFCPARVPSPSAVDLYLLRKGQYTQAGFDQVRPYFVILNSSRSVVADAALADTPAYWKGSTTSFQTVAMTPPADLSALGQATLAGSVSGANIFRQQDFDALGGSFTNFVKALPVVTLYDSTGALRGAGLVTTAPGCLNAPGAQDAFDQAIAANSFTAFKALFASGGACFNAGKPFGFEIRGLTPGATYTAVVTSPNYPSFSTAAVLGVAGSTTTLILNLDSSAGAGGTLTGVVKSTAGVVIANAAITYQSSALDAKTVATNALGVYTIPGLPAGAYSLAASAAGFASGAADANVAAAPVAVNFALRAGGSSISGTVYAQTVPSVVVQPGAQIFAYNDTLNATSPSVSLALFQAVTDADGAYTLDGLEAGKVYKVFLSVPGRYILSQSILTAAGDTPGVDFTVQTKPADVEIFGHRAVADYQFTLQNPDGLVTEQAWIGGNPFDVSAATDVSSSLASLPGGKKTLSYPLASLVSGQTYVLHLEASFESGESVSRELIFTTDRANNSHQNIDTELLGDASADEAGNGSNEAHIDPTGADPSAVTLPPGAAIPASDDAVPALSFDQQDAAGAPEAALLGSTSVFAGGVYRVGLSSVNLTDRGFDLTLGYDKSKGGTGKGLVIAHFNSDAVNPAFFAARCLWTAVPGLQALDPLSGALTAQNLLSVAGVLSVPRRVHAVNYGRGYRPNGLYRTQSAEDDGTYAVVNGGQLASAPPSAPVATGTAVGSDSILWTWPKVNTATYYRLYPSTGGAPFNVTPNYYLMTNLSTGTVYSLQVSAVNTCNEGRLSTSATTYSLAAAPTDVAVDTATVFVSTALVTWTDAVNPPGTKYKVEWYKASTPATILTKLSTVPYSALTALTPGTSYYARVRAINAKGVIGLYDTPAAFWTLPLKVTAAPAPKFAPTAITAANPDTLIADSATWSWAAVPNAQYYEVYEIVGGAFDLASPTQTVWTTSVTLTGLTANTPYGIRVRARNDFTGPGPLSAAVTGYSLAATPSGTSVQPAHLSLVVTWNANGAAANTTYQVQYKKSSAAAWTSVVSTASAAWPVESKTITGLLAATNYDVRVRSLNKSLVPGVPDATQTTQPAAIVRTAETAAAPTWDWTVPAAQVKRAAATAAATSSAALARVLAFPNPLLPGQPGVSFVNVPEGATVRIVDSIGALVREFTAGASGSLFWNGADSRGKKAPAGVYPAHVESGSASRTIDISVQR